MPHPVFPPAVLSCADWARRSDLASLLRPARWSQVSRGLSPSAYAKQSEAQGDLCSAQATVGHRSTRELISDDSRCQELQSCQPFVASVSAGVRDEQSVSGREHLVLRPVAFGPMSRSNFNSTTPGSSPAPTREHGHSERLPRGAEMAGAGEPSVLHDGNDQDDVCAAGDGREGSKVDQVRPAQVHRVREPGPRQVPPHRSSYQPGESVCKLAGVQDLQRPDQLREPRKEQSFNMNESAESPKRSRASLGTGKSDPSHSTREMVR